MQNKKFSLLTVLTVAVSPMMVMFAASPVMALSALSITGTGISSNSSEVNTALTSPTVNFTLGSNLTVADQSIRLVLSGLDVDAGFTVADLTLTGCTTNTLEAAPGTADNGVHEVALVNNTTAASDPQITITLDSDTGTPPSCSGAMTLEIDTTGAADLSSSATADNYAMSITTSLESGAFFYYVGNENDVQVTATVDPVLSFVIRNTADSADQANVGGGAVGPNLCDLGNLSVAGVQTCSYRLKVSTNAASGYAVNVATDGSLRKGSDFINNVTEDTTVTSGTEGYGIAFAAGSYDPDGAGGAYTPTACSESGDFSDDDTPTATGLAVGINTGLMSCAGPNSPAATDTTNTALVTHRAEADSGTPSGTYDQLVTYTVSASF